ncbi:hypothetical protein ACHAXT_003111 [Thalassiosira profunda]
MIYFLRLLLLLAAATWQMAGVAASPSVGSELQTYRIQRSHIFHVEPRAVVDAVLSDVRGQPLSQDVDASPVLDIDVSSARLDDDALGALMDGVLALLKEKAAEGSRDEGNAPLLVKLALDMNRITPSGASSLFDRLIKKEVIDDATPTENGEVEEMADAEAESDVATGSGDSDTQGESATNETIVEEVSGSASTQVESSTDTSQVDEETPAPDTEQPGYLLEELDLSFNDIGGHGMHPPNAHLLESARRLFECSATAFVPRVLTLENCGIGPAFCRSIGRGILNAFERKSVGPEYRPSVLRIGGNSAIDDAGAVALAAALRMAGSGDSGSCIFDELVLTSCGVGDAGAEALALALESNPGCVKRMDLSNNKISDAGAKSLGRGLVDANQKTGTVFEQIVLDNNKGIGDEGVEALAEALACGAVKSISLRSCSVQAQGTAAFGEALVLLASRKGCEGHFHLDLSGNHFGTNKIKKKSKLSASALKDRASTNIKFIGKTLKGAAKSWGMTADSDDDEEVMSGLIEEEEEEDVSEDKIQACGGHAFAGEVLRGESKDGDSSVEISVGMRQCLLDDGAIDALSAAVLATKCKMSVDVSMNSAAEDDAVAALMEGRKDSDVLEEMAKRHMDLLDRINDARQRLLEAAEDIGGSFFDEEDDFFEDDAYDFD